MTALVIGYMNARVDRIHAAIDPTLPDALDRAVALALTIEGDWDIVIAGDHVDVIETRACSAIWNERPWWWRIVVDRICGRMVGSGPASLTRELGLAADFAANFSRWSRTVFVFRDDALRDALGGMGHGLPIEERRYTNELVAVMTRPGFLGRG
jgi:hypothetical protein